jgi:hypothetical protein
VASYALNERAVARARALIESRQYVLNSDWGEVQPRAAAENAYLSSHSWEEYGEWHLGLTDGPSNDTKARYASCTETSAACIERDSSHATTARPNGGIRRSNSRRTTSCSFSTSRAPSPPPVSKSRFESYFTAHSKAPQPRKDEGRPRETALAEERNDALRRGAAPLLLRHRLFSSLAGAWRGRQIA